MKHMKISASLDKGTPNMALASMVYVISPPPSNNQRFCDMEIAVIVGKGMKIFTDQNQKGTFSDFTIKQE